MKIRALTLLHGSEITAKAGDIVTVDDAFGQALIAAGAAVEMPPSSPPETTALETPPEQATLPAAKPRKASPPDAPHDAAPESP